MEIEKALPLWGSSDDYARIRKFVPIRLHRVTSSGAPTLLCRFRFDIYFLHIQTKNHSFLAARTFFTLVGIFFILIKQATHAKQKTLKNFPLHST